MSLKTFNGVHSNGANVPGDISKLGMYKMLQSSGAGLDMNTDELMAVRNLYCDLHE